MTASEVRAWAQGFWLVMAVEAVLLLLVALATWGLGGSGPALSLAAGFGLFCLVTFCVPWFVAGVQSALGVNMDDRYNAFVLSNLAVSATLLVAWAAFAALTFGGAAADAAIWRAALLYLLGLFSCHMAFTVMGEFYSGTFYRYNNLPIMAVAYVVFCAWPPAARFLFGWFFGLWG